MKYNVERHPGEYCANECRNRECPVNSKNKPKGEWNWTPKPFCGTSQCKGYIRPGSYEGGKGELTMITNKSDHIRVEGHRGTWYVVDSGTYRKDSETKRLFLLEHETYGDMAACVIVNEDGVLVLEDVWNGFEDLEYEGWEESA